MNNQSLLISADELVRARKRVGDPKWQNATEALRKEAERLLALDRPKPKFDCSWFDADPDRDYTVTYQEFHKYIHDGGRYLTPMVKTLTNAAMVFEDERYLKKALKWTMEVVEGLKFHVKHYDSGMEYAFTADFLAEVYSVAVDYLSDDQRKRYVAQMQACGEAIWDCNELWLNDPHLAGMPYNNHFAFHWRGLMAVGLILDNSTWVNDAIDGPRGFGELLVGANYDNGLCYESSTGYHYATANALLSIAELTRHQPELGRDLYREIFANGRCLKQMFDAPLGLLWPSCEHISIGDCYARRNVLGQYREGTYELVHGVYNDPHYAWVLKQTEARESTNALLYGQDNLDNAQTPSIGSKLWPEHGYCLVTSSLDDEYWDGKGYGAVISGDRSGIHHHLDGLSVQVFAGGKLWIEDVESSPSLYHGFSDPIQEVFNRTVMAHNKVVVDESNQQTLDQPLVARQFVELDDCSLVTMADEGKLYPGVIQQRSLVVTDDFCLDVYQLKSDAEHTYDWLVHPRADGEAEVNVKMQPTEIDTQPWSKVLRDNCVGKVDKDVKLSWGQGDVLFNVAVRADETGELLKTCWPNVADWSDGGREMFMYRVKAKQAEFVALYQLENGETWQVDSVERFFDGKDNRISIVVGCGDKKRKYLFECVG